MREVVGDLSTYPCDAIVVPINWTLRTDGTAVMGAGVAKVAAERWPWLPEALGNQIRRPVGPAVVCFQATTTDGRLLHLLLVPTKHDWRQPSTVALVEWGAKRLVDIVDRHGWRTVALPRLGCGRGGLRWADVRPVLAPLLDDTFVVVSRVSDSENVVQCKQQAALSVGRTQGGHQECES